MKIDRTPRACRQCGSTQLASRGRIARGRVLAGHALVPAWPGGTLYECADCALVFRHPIASENDYEQLYTSADDTTYAHRTLRHDQQLARQAILEHVGAGSVLDVGCFDGALLDSLGERFEKFGVEASRAALEVCKARSIDVLATSIRELPDIRKQFDLVCAIDVIEHTAEPLKFLAALAALTRPGGTVLLSTGNAAATAWRMFGGRYWYCSFPEHISFLSPAWLRAAAATLGLSVTRLEPFRYGRGGTSRAAALFGFSRRLLSATAESLLSPALPEYERLGPRYVLGFPGAVADHLLVALQVDRPPAAGALQRENRLA